MQLNPHQKQAVNHISGPALVIAGPGSGKTAVIIRRIKSLTEKNIPPENILVITFTRAAAEEMKSRFISLKDEDRDFKGKSGACPAFGTFHSIFFEILRHETGLCHSNIASEKEKYGIIKEILLLHPIPGESDDSVITSILDDISYVKNRGYSPDYNPRCASKSEFDFFLKQYLSAMREKKLIDFDDMILVAYKLLKNSPATLRKWQSKYRYILVDEFQDVNMLQYRLIKMLASESANLFVVGDDDQSIYGFRGSDPGIMQKFAAEYKNAKLIKLNTNYRSDPEIVRLASNIISHNENRFDKKLVPGNTALSPGSIEISSFDDITIQNNRILELIKKLCKSGSKYGDIAILFRTVSLSAPLVLQLESNGIPFVAEEKPRNVFTHWIYKDLMSYLRIVSGRRLRADFLRIINRPVRYIKREAFQNEIVRFEDLQKIYTGTEVAESLRRFENQLDIARKMRPYAAVNFIRKAIGYDNYIREFANKNSLDIGSLYETEDLIMEFAAGTKTFDEFFENMKKAEKNFSEKQKASEDTKSSEDAVHICTMHKSKGLEYDTVILPDCNEGLIPYKRAKLPEEIEEERRIFYVAVTRAKKNLHIYYVKNRFCRNTEKSRFLTEI